MSAYVIARFDIFDPEAAKIRFPQYVEEARPASVQFGSQYLVRGGVVQAMEGPARGRNVVIAFADMDAALGWHRCDVYKAASRHRLAVAEGEIVAVEGLPDAGTPASSFDTKKGYWIGRYDVHDAEVHKRYVEAGAPAFAEFGARFLARGGAFEALEGQARARNILVEFPSVQHAVDCYRSDTYQSARQHRLPVSTGEIVIIEAA